MSSYDKKRKVASKMMGGYKLGPATPSDKKMSERHLKHRATVEKTAKEGNKEKALKMSVKYNKEHMKEHAKHLKKAEKDLQKQNG